MTNKQTIIDKLEYVIDNLTSDDVNLASAVNDLHKVIRAVEKIREHEECNRSHCTMCNNQQQQQTVATIGYGNALSTSSFRRLLKGNNK